MSSFEEALWVWISLCEEFFAINVEYGMIIVVELNLVKYEDATMIIPDSTLQAVPYEKAVKIYPCPKMKNMTNWAHTNVSFDCHSHFKGRTKYLAFGRNVHINYEF